MSTFRRGSPGGFTLVELLAAMAVLAIVVIFLGRVFREAAAAFSAALTTVERNSVVEVAMEQIVRDLEGMVIDSNLACRVVSNTTDTHHSRTNQNGMGFDEIWFVTTTSKLKKSDSAYLFVRYRVEPQILTSVGYRYQTFFLRRDAWKLERLRKEGIDPFGADREWWDHMDGVESAPPDVLLQHVVRFDIYVMGTDTQVVYTGNSGDAQLDRPRFQSLPDTITPDNYDWYTYPVSFDIYLQATSGEVMRRQGRSMLLALESGDWILDRKARSVMFRQSNVLVTRVLPVVARAQNLHLLPY